MSSTVTTILTVEDEALISAHLCSVLEEAGHNVIATSNPDKAIEVLEVRDDIRLVITDVNLPGSMDGLKLAAAVKRKWPPIKIIITTALGKVAEEDMPADSVFLPKPWDTGRLLSTIDRIVGA
jgi:two-component system, response regulator PdtaR